MIKIVNKHKHIHVFNVLTMLIVSAPLTAQAASAEATNYAYEPHYYNKQYDSVSYKNNSSSKPVIEKEDFFIDETYSQFVWGETVYSDIPATAEKLVGEPYVMAGAHPRSGFDCSGLVRFLYASAEDVFLQHSATAQAETGIEIPMSAAKPGDLITYGSPGNYDHIGVYVGDGEMIHASSNGGVKKTSINIGRSDYIFIHIPH